MQNTTSINIIIVAIYVNHTEANEVTIRVIIRNQYAEESKHTERGEETAYTFLNMKETLCTNV